MSSSSSGGGFGIGTIVFGIIMYNLFFGGSDKPKTKTIETQASEPQKKEIVRNEPEAVTRIKKETKQIIENAKKEIENSHIKDDVKELFGNFGKDIKKDNTVAKIEKEEIKPPIIKEEKPPVIKQDKPYELKSGEGEAKEEDGKKL